MKTRFIILITIMLMLCGVSTGAQDVPEVKIRIVPSHKAVVPGSDLVLFAEYRMPPETHLTQNFLEMALDSEPKIETVSAGMLEVTPGVFLEDELIRRDTAILKLPLSISPDQPHGELTIKGYASYQICTEGEHFMCFPPKQIPFDIRITIARESVQNPAVLEIERQFKEKSASDETLEGRLSSALDKGSWMALMIVFVAGFLTSLTPCIYPMIPITIGYIGGRSAGHGKWRGFVLSLFYVLGLAVIYSSLGVVAALTKSLFGSITQTPLIVGIVGVIFAAMGLSMLGIFDISLPSGIATKLQGSGPRRGFFGAMIMGMVAGLVAAPCAGPVVILLLTYIATTGRIVVGFSLMMAFAFGMGIIFLILGTFSGLLTSLPSAGMWMDKVKKTFGVLMIAAAIWIVGPSLPPPLSGILWGVFSVMLAALIGLFEKLEEGAETTSRFRKGLALILAVAGLYMIISLLPVPGRVVPTPGTPEIGGGTTAGSAWRTDLDQALIDAKQQNRPILIDFGAEWCAACKELEHKTFSNDEIKTILADYMLIRIDCTDSKSQRVRDIQERFDVKGLPTVIYLSPAGEEVARFVSFLPPAQFKRFMESARASAVTAAE